MSRRINSSRYRAARSRSGKRVWAAALHAVKISATRMNVWTRVACDVRPNEYVGRGFDITVFYRLVRIYRRHTTKQRRRLRRLPGLAYPSRR